MPSLALTGTEVLQGNLNGATLLATAQDTVLWTNGLVGCVAVCGYNGVTAFMIHSDSTGTGGTGATDLITGIRRLVAGIGTGAGFTVTLIGGSVAGVKGYLETAGNLPDATFVEGDATDAAYITWNGKAASTKAKLATELGVDSVTIQ
jgi:hypothetical protein